jgi:MoaA/NifB/PqqE/SkfB family radical SAM enzyme
MWRYPDRLAALRTGELAAPVHVRIKPTNVCNHSCWFCAYRRDGLSLGADMVERDRIPREKMAEIVDDLIAMGVEAVTFSGGGEPLIYPYFVETVERLASAGVKIGVLTNGSRLKGKVADTVARCATWLRVSIDGWDGPSYARYRSVPADAFAQVTANLAAFAARGSACEVGASVIVDRDNAAHISELVRTLEGAGVRHVKVSPCIISNDGDENRAYHAPFAAIVHGEIARARAAAGPGFAIVDHYHTDAADFGKSYHRCAFLQFLTVIGADGTVYTCQDKAYTASGALGSLKDRRFREFWLSGENRDRLQQLDPAHDCRHHCVADAKNCALDDYLSLDPDHAAFV